MLTYDLSARGKEPLYQYLYQCIKTDIIGGRLPSHHKLPSKRTLAQHLKLSVNTVQSAYDQLLAEGYLYAVAKSGYFVSALEDKPALQTPIPEATTCPTEEPFFSFNESRTSGESFPYSVWARQLREVLSEKNPVLFRAQSYLGSDKLRHSIAGYLMQFRNMTVSPEQIIIGAGTEYLYTMLIRLLGKSKVYALEEPGYGRIFNIYHNNEVQCVHLPMDESGLSISALLESNAEVVHISPSHHFPTGVVTPITRRMELIKWANMRKERYIIEDDYDSEFRFDGKPIPPMQSIDQNGKVIYMNTFSKTISPAIRISYMVLPPHLLEIARREFGFSSCPVSSFEQETLAKFIEKGHFERHINRMRRVYRNHRNAVIEEIYRAFEGRSVDILEEDAGLHFLLRLETEHSDAYLKEKASEQGIKLTFLSEYYYHKENCPAHLLVMNYAGMDIHKLPEALRRLSTIC